jgi:hypothetical protein
METDREFLKKLGLPTPGGMLGGSLKTADASTANSYLIPLKKSNGLQLYSPGWELTEDVPNGLKKVVEIGYSTTEAAGN